MRVLHLFSNYKWTGPAEPALNLCVGLKALGVGVDFACGPDAGKQINKVVETARERGIEPNLDFYLTKYYHLIKNASDVRTLNRLLKKNKYDIIHCHMNNDHSIAIKPALRKNIPLIRSSYYGDGFPVNFRTRRLLKHCDLLIEPSHLAKTNDLKNFGLPESKTVVVPGAVDVHRFAPKRTLPIMRDKFNLVQDQFIIGIVARMQTHRHYEDLFQAFHKFVQEAPNAHLVVVGRGTKQETVGFQPVRDLGLEKNVTFTGFIDGEDYVGMLNAMDAGVYLVPGSDGTCRTVREIMAMGKPVIVANRSILPELVENGTDGLVFDNSVDGLYRAFCKLHQDRNACKAMGHQAREKACVSYSIEAQAQAIKNIYNQVLNE